MRRPWPTTGCYAMGDDFVCFWHNSPQWAMASSFTRFLDHTQRRITFDSTPVDEWSARRRDPYLTTHITHNRQTSMPTVGFEPTISAGERPQTHSLDRAATGTGDGGWLLCWSKEWEHCSWENSVECHDICCFFHIHTMQHLAIISFLFTKWCTSELF